ncbi:MAG: hypothetical protein ABIS39_00630 [Sphingomicrobium sp.]
MQGRYFFAAVAISMLSPAAALAGEVVRKPVCPKSEPPRQLTPQQQQQRQRAPDCRVYRSIPPLVDPTPIFLL